MPLFILLVIVSCILLAGCDSISGLFEENSEQVSRENDTFSEEAPAMTILLEILDSQELLIAEIKDQVVYGDKSLLKQNYESLMELEERYQEEYANYAEKLTYSESVQVSDRHQKIIKSIPSYSSLLQ